MWLLEMMHAEAMRGAAALLARRGYDNVQACELARAMHMSVGSLYRRYGSKQGLALAVRDYTEKELSYRADVAFFMKHVRPGVDFGQAFHAFWRELVGCALAQPDLFGFTFLHWHAQAHGPHSPPPPGPRVAGALLPQSNGGATRALVRQVLEKGEKEGVLAPGCAWVGEGLVWGTLLELARAARQGARVGEAEVRASADALWRALTRAEDSGPRGTGIPHPGAEEPSSGTPGSLGMAPEPSLEESSTGTPGSLAAARAPVLEESSTRTPGGRAAACVHALPDGLAASIRPVGAASRVLPEGPVVETHRACETPPMFQEMPEPGGTFAPPESEAHLQRDARAVALTRREHHQQARVVASIQQEQGAVEEQERGALEEQGTPPTDELPGVDALAALPQEGTEGGREDIQSDSHEQAPLQPSPSAEALFQGQSLRVLCRQQQCTYHRRAENGHVEEGVHLVEGAPRAVIREEVPRGAHRQVRQRPPGEHRQRRPVHRNAA